MKTISALVAISALVLLFLAGSTFLTHVSAQSAITLKTVADITGDGATHTIGNVGTARWVQIATFSTNTSIIRIGDATVSATRGAPLAPGAAYLIPPSISVNLWYDLNGIYYYAAVGDKLSISFGN